MTVQLDLEKIYTLEEFAALPDDGGRYELIDGKLVEMPPANEEHGRVESLLHSRLAVCVEDNELGTVYSSDTAFDIGGRGLCPDTAFVAKGRLKKEQRGLAIIPLAPDLVIEVKSPSEYWPKVVEKVGWYLAAGVRLIWVVDPSRQNVRVYRQGQPGYDTLERDQELDGEEVVKGFKYKIERMFWYV